MAFHYEIRELGDFQQFAYVFFRHTHFVNVYMDKDA